MVEEYGNWIVHTIVGLVVVTTATGIIVTITPFVNGYITALM